MTPHDHQRLHGIAVSPGVAVGPLVVVAPAPVAPPDEPAPTDVAASLAQVRQVLQEVAEQLLARAHEAGPQARTILETDAMMARDPGLAQAIEEQLTQGKGPATAVTEAIAGYSATFETLGGYMAERVTDLLDIRDRVVARLLGLPSPGVPTLTTGSILAAHDLAPAETATLTRETCLGIIVEAGGPTSHTAIVAAGMGIPAIVQVAGVLSVPSGTPVAMDGGTGEVTINPSIEAQTQLNQRAGRREAALASAIGPGATSDAHPVALLANIGTLDDAHHAAASSAEGVGLFRTEFLFLGRDTMPSLEEQTQTYTEVFSLFSSRRVVVRTLDAGADKPLKFADLGPEENPALGRRGIRLGMARPELLNVQLAALASAQQITGVDLRVMAPMIATESEAQWFATHTRSAGLTQVGVMIEIPAAAVRSHHILPHVDFASLGTNDLAQYTMGADRMQGELADLLDPLEPALLDVVALACEGGQTTGKPIGVCGEAGGNPLSALVLVGLGVSSLSMAPTRLPAVRYALSLHTLEQCQQLAKVAREASSAHEARTAVLELVDPALRDVI